MSVVEYLCWEWWDRNQDQIITSLKVAQRTGNTDLGNPYMKIIVKTLNVGQVSEREMKNEYEGGCKRMCD